MVKISRYRGVEFIPSVNKLNKPWRATIGGGQFGGYTTQLGMFETELEAVTAYNEACPSRRMEPNIIIEEDVD